MVPEKSLNTYPDTQYITGLKGYAVLWIFLIHVGGYFRQFGPRVNSFVDFGRYAVESFFLLSAFTVSLSLYRTKNFHYIKYLIRRYFRIAPVYYLVLIIALFTVRSGWKLTNTPLFDLKDFIFHLLFINLNSVNSAYQASIIGIEWFVPIIFLYYLVIPMLFFLSKKRLYVLLLMAFPGVFLYFHPELFYVFSGTSGYVWTAPYYFVTYIFGMLCFELFRKFRKPEISKHNDFLQNLLGVIFGLFLVGVILVLIGDFKEIVDFSVLFAMLGYLLFIKKNFLTKITGRWKKFIDNSDVLLLIAILCIYASRIFGNPGIFMALITGVFVIALSYRSGVSVLLFENRLIVRFGKISYSIFLSHYVITNILSNFIKNTNTLAYFFIVFFITLFISYLLNRFVEMPSMRVGNKLSERKLII